MIRKMKYRCSYSFPCDVPYSRHCFEIVPIESPDPPGHCNHDNFGEDPDVTPEGVEAGQLYPDGLTDGHGNPA